MVDQPTRPDLFANTAHLARGALAAISGVLGASVAVYFLGWLYAFSYFGSCGALWILPRLGASHFLSLSWLPVFQVVTLLSFTFSAAVSADYKAESFVMSRTYERVLTGLSGLLLVAAFVGDRYLVEWASDVLRISASVSLSLLSSAILLDLIEKAKDRRWRHRNYYSASILVSFLVVSLMSAGDSAARRDFNPVRSTLPVAEQDGHAWRLVVVLDDQALLATLGDGPKTARFKVAPLSSVFISSRHR